MTSNKGQMTGLSQSGTGCSVTKCEDSLAGLHQFPEAALFSPGDALNTAPPWLLVALPGRPPPTHPAPSLEPILMALSCFPAMGPGALWPAAQGPATNAFQITEVNK